MEKQYKEGGEEGSHLERLFGRTLTILETLDARLTALERSVQQQAFVQQNHQQQNVKDVDAFKEEKPKKVKDEVALIGGGGGGV